MKKHWFMLGTMILLSACGGTSSEENKENTETAVTETAPQASKVSTLIFLDKSRSVNEDKDFVEKKYTKVINSLVQEEIRRAGDNIQVWLIHENTAQSKALDLTSQTTLDATEGMSQTDVEAAEANYDLALQRERLNFAKQVLAQLATPNVSKSSEQTDIQASLAAINARVGEGYAVKVYYFSDMVESMKQPGRRDFHKTPPKSTAEADAWAKADAASLKARYPNLSSVEVSIVLPFEPTTSSKVNNPNVSEYWKTFFNEVGVKKVEEKI
ncbi:hypothetical protein [Siphonobacter sp. SORGH_AS_0500]|uniref:hypothetical protein n=1 Tax=Siphonobacter sp. SORGH_AS_0500 TaxID=1864824 RepID=UPI002863F09A|nr:hypothetical protein [Siphonobacter sp. SORGH_AS_0500]MDR6196960.1 hypothetical protein [Siphonobacter sp. SORGH_AS_0500]